MTDLETRQCISRGAGAAQTPGGCAGEGGCGLQSICRTTTLARGGLGQNRAVSGLGQLWGKLRVGGEGKNLD